jgi:hypothetical protein
VFSEASLSSWGKNIIAMKPLGRTRIPADDIHLRVVPLSCLAVSKSRLTCVSDDVTASVFRVLPTMTHNTVSFLKWQFLKLSSGIRHRAVW